MGILSPIYSREPPTPPPLKEVPIIILYYIYNICLSLPLSWLAPVLPDDGSPFGTTSIKLELRGYTFQAHLEIDGHRIKRVYLSAPGPKTQSKF